MEVPSVFGMVAAFSYEKQWVWCMFLCVHTHAFMQTHIVCTVGTPADMLLSVIALCLSLLFLKAVIRLPDGLPAWYDSV